MRRLFRALPLLLLACRKAPPLPKNLPPSGYYEVRYEITSWDCTTEKPKPLTEKRTVVTTTKDGGGTMVRANVWGEELASGNINVVAQTDLPLRQGEKRTTKAHTEWHCPTRADDTFEAEVATVAHDEVRLKVARNYPDASVCDAYRPWQPSKCRGEALVVFKLLEAKCELPCTGKEEFTAPGSRNPQIKCTCSGW
jgi:hypothetical protein